MRGAGYMQYIGCVLVDVGDKLLRQSAFLRGKSSHFLLVERDA